MRYLFALALVPGCTMAAEVDRPDIIAALAVRYAAIMTSQDDTPAPTPTPSGDCTTGCRCNGTGKERTGDGLSVVDCRCPDNCKCKANSSEIPNSSPATKQDPPAPAAEKAAAPPKPRSEDPPLVEVPQARFRGGRMECSNGACYYIDNQTGKRYRVN